MKKIHLLFVAALSLFFLSACGANNGGESITAVGSTALQPLVEAAGESYAANHLGAFINVQGGGSGTGLSQIQTGAVNIGNSDEFAEEKSGIDASKLVDHRVAVVGITPIVNKDVGVSNVSKADLIKIFTGEVTNWKQVGGKNVPVVIVNRAQGSGTRNTFEKFALEGKTPKQAQEQDSNGMVRSIIANTPGAISYVAFSYVNKDVKSLKVDGVKPTDQNVTNNAWKIWSYEHMYTKGTPKKLTKKFIAYVLSEEVQKKVVPKLGYISIAKMKVDRDVTGKVTER